MNQYFDNPMKPKASLLATEPTHIYQFTTFPVNVMKSAIHFHAPNIDKRLSKYTVGHTNISFVIGYVYIVFLKPCLAFLTFFTKSF